MKNDKNTVRVISGDTGVFVLPIIMGVEWELTARVQL